jgi:hypothetical protein
LPSLFLSHAVSELRLWIWITTGSFRRMTQNRWNGKRMLQEKMNQWSQKQWNKRSEWSNALSTPDSHWISLLQANQERIIFQTSCCKQIKLGKLECVVLWTLWNSLLFQKYKNHLLLYLFVFFFWPTLQTEPEILLPPRFIFSKNERSKIPQLTPEFFRSYSDDLYDQYYEEMKNIHNPGTLMFKNRREWTTEKKKKNDKNCL